MWVFLFFVKYTNTVLIPPLLIKDGGVQWKQVRNCILLSLTMKLMCRPICPFIHHFSFLVSQRERFLPPQSVCLCSMSVWSLSLCFSQVYKCSPSSRTPSRKAVPAATGRSRTATCWRPSISTGMKTASSVPAVTAGWARWAPRSTPKPTSSCAEETTYGKTADILIASVWRSTNQAGHSVYRGEIHFTHIKSSLLFCGVAHSQIYF